MKNIKIVVICSGNTCRSPMAEALLAKALERETGAFEVVGVGLSSIGGNIENNTILAMKKIGIDLSGYKSKNLTQDIINEAVVVFCMTKEHLNS
ncbi:MAG: low molecular weight protein arginine phosphatase, partial [Puniceicoccales bacterium]|nr:low molecular weight protein arginine phosphatase [Puniceicoccales bacterium]